MGWVTGRGPISTTGVADDGPGADPRRHGGGPPAGHGAGRRGGRRGQLAGRPGRRPDAATGRGAGGRVRRRGRAGGLVAGAPRGRGGRRHPPVRRHDDGVGGRGGGPRRRSSAPAAAARLDAAAGGRLAVGGLAGRGRRGGRGLPARLPHHGTDGAGCLRRTDPGGAGPVGRPAGAAAPGADDGHPRTRPVHRGRGARPHAGARGRRRRHQELRRPPDRGEADRGAGARDPGGGGPPAAGSAGRAGGLDGRAGPGLAAGRVTQLPADRNAQAVSHTVPALTASATGTCAAMFPELPSAAWTKVSTKVVAASAAVEEQDDAAAALTAAAEAAYTRACHEVSDGVGNGSLLRGEVLARWQEYVGTGEWMPGLQGQVSRLRDRVTAAVTGRPAPGAELQGALESGVEVLLRDAADEAAERTVTTWRTTPGGTGLLAGRQTGLERSSPEFPDAAGEQVRDWQGHVLDLVRREGAGKRSQARLLSWGVNGTGAAVMVAVFAQTGGLTGGGVGGAGGPAAGGQPGLWARFAEPAGPRPAAPPAGGTTAVGQRVLEAVFGDAAVRRLAARAREDLEQRANRLLSDERTRFDALLDDAAPPPGSADELRAALGALADARRSGR